MNNQEIEDQFIQMQLNEINQHTSRSNLDTLNPTLTSENLVLWARRVISEHNHTPAMQRQILSRNLQTTINTRRNIFNNNQELICAYFILSNENQYHQQDGRTTILNPLTGRELSIQGSSYDAFMAQCNLRARRNRRVLTPSNLQPEQETNNIQAAQEARETIIREVGNIEFIRDQHNERLEWARRILGTTRNDNLILTTRQLRNMFTEQRINRVEQRRLLNNISIMRGNLTDDQKCAYYILSNYTINPSTGYTITRRNRLMQLCNSRVGFRDLNYVPPVAQPVARPVAQPVAQPFVQPVNRFISSSSSSSFSEEPNPNMGNSSSSRSSSPNQQPNGPIRNQNRINNTTQLAQTVTVTLNRGSPRHSTNDNENNSHTRYIPEILDNCKALFGHIADTPGPFQSFGKLMLRICSKAVIRNSNEINKPNSTCPNTRDIRIRLYNIYRPIFQSSNKITVKNVDSNNILPFIFNAWLKKPPVQRKTFFKRNINNGFYILQNQFYGVGIDAGGVSRAILSKLAEQIKDFCTEGYPDKNAAPETKLFIESVTDSNRYILNPRFRLREDMFRMNASLIGYSEDQILRDQNLQKLHRGIGDIDGYNQINENYRRNGNLTQLIYEFVGAYYAFCILNSINIEFPLSRNILYGLYQNQSSFDKNKIITYYLIDNSGKPGLARTITKAGDSYMQSPDIYLSSDNGEEGLAGSFNDYAEQFHNDLPRFNIIERDQPINVQNLKDYIYRVAMYENFGISIPTHGLYKIAQSFYNGFNSFGLRERLHIILKNKPIISLDRILSAYIMPSKPLLGESMSYPLVYIIHSKDTTTMKYFINYVMVPVPSVLTGNNNRIFTWMKEILFNYGTDYPDTSNNQTSKVELFKEFFKKLIAFWSGNPAILWNVQYKINIVHTITPGSIPISHTCFYTLDIPNNVSSKEDLYRRLITSVSYSEPGIGNAGGGKTMKK